MLQPQAAAVALFRSSLPRVLVRSAIAAVGSGLLFAEAFAAVAVITGTTTADTLRGATLGALVSATVAFGYRVLPAIGHPHWVRLSGAGLEIGRPRRRTVLLPWPGVASATRRGRWVFATLHVVPTADPRFWLQDGDGEAPQVRLRDWLRTYQLRVWIFPDGGAELIAALRARGVGASTRDLLGA